MRNLKFPTIFAVFGFALSLFFGFFSRANFGFILIRALIFAAVFFGLGFLIKIVFDKFLDEDSGSDVDGVQLSTPENSPVADSSLKGQHVDLVVEDQELDSETSDNHYLVGQNHQMLSEADLHKNTGSTSANFNQASTVQNAVPSAPVSASQKSVAEKPSESAANAAQNESAASGFVPLGKESFKKFSGTEAINPVEVQPARSKTSNSSEGLDVLPDMSDLELSNSSEFSEDADTSESDFADSAVDYKNNDSSETEVKDASLMAKAISSLLSAESQ